MNRGIVVMVAVFFVISYSTSIPDEQIPEIHCKHFLYGYPLGTPKSNDLIIRDCYALSSNDTTKFADWAAYRIDAGDVIGHPDLTRKWRADPWLDETETLEPKTRTTTDDYKDANKQIKTDRGHQAPLASFRNTKCWHESNYLSNITPQKSALNQGPWMRLEGKVRDLTLKVDKPIEGVFVLTGPLYETNMPPLPKADESHKVPSGYWKIVAVPDGASIKVVGFIFPQSTPRSAKAKDYTKTVDVIESRSGLDFFRELPDTVESQVESTNDQDLKDLLLL